ncbi:MAG: hypothetical protein FWD27_01565 [Coriobacteriia bacterium]|nr:hypothetical protein [Coriobacteriia bacterium]
MTAIIVSILRILLPLLVLFLVWRFVIPRMRRPYQAKSERINVDAQVVNTEQHKVNLEDYKSSDVYYKPQSTSKKSNEH